MYSIVRSLFLIILLAVCAGKSQAQTYPVSAQLLIQEPFAPYWSSFEDPTQNNLQVLLQNNDPFAGTVEVMLQFEFSGPGFLLRSRTDIPLEHIELDPAVPHLLDPQVLSDYFDVSKWQVIHGQFPSLSHPLTDGNYSICVRVLHATHPQQLALSDQSCDFTFFSIPEAPQLLSPACGVQLDDVSGVPLYFQWTMPFMAHHQFIDRLEYEFELFALTGAYADPNLVVHASRPLFTQKVSQTFYEYSAFDPMLVPGWTYCWRIRVLDRDGELYFQNNGYTSPCTFQFGESPFSSLELNLLERRQHALKLSWNAVPGADYYELRYRKANGTQWYTVTASYNEMLIDGLEPSTAYETEGRALVQQAAQEWSPVLSASTLSVPVIACNQNDPLFTESAYSPLQLALPGMHIQAGLFTMELIEINALSNPGFFRGRGMVKVYDRLPLSVSFDRIFIDDQRIMRDGIVVSETQGLGNWINEQTVGTIAEGTEEAENHWDETIDQIEIDTASGLITINGESTNIEWDDEAGTTIEDASGELYIISEEGEIIHAGTSGEGYGTQQEDEKITGGLAQVKVLVHPQALYGTDVFQYPEIKTYYEEIGIHQSTERRIVDWKSIRASKYDKISFRIDSLQSGITADSIRFITGTGTVYLHQHEGSVFTINAIGGAHGDGQELFVQAKTSLGWKNIGKLNIVHYKQRTEQVVIIRFGENYSTESIVPTGFHNGVVKWETVYRSMVLPELWDKNSDGKLECTGVSHSDEMDILIDAVKEMSWYKREHYYLLVWTSPVSDPELRGEMPRGSHFGFLFPGQNGSDSRSASHELGHGALGLEHSFSGNTPIAQGITTNIMDYGTGAGLFKFQWDKIHDPAWLSGLGDDEEDVALYIHNSNGEKVLVQGKNYAYLTPTGKAIRIDDLSHAEFNTFGALIWFRKTSGETFSSVSTGDDYFFGYISNNKTQGLEGTLTDERFRRLKADLFTDYVFAEDSAGIFSRSAMRVDGIATNCFCNYTWKNSVVSSSLEGQAIFNLIPEHAAVSQCTGTACFNPVSAGVEAGIGRELFMKLRPTLPADFSEFELVELCNTLNEDCNGKHFAFFGHGMEVMMPATRFSNDHVRKFRELNIYSLDRLNTFFSERTFARNADVIYSTCNLRATICPNYNVNSIDFVARRGGVEKPYEYSFGDLVIRKQQEPNPWIGALHTEEAAGNAGPISITDYYQQYVACFGTNSAIFFWMENYFLEVAEPPLMLSVSKSMSRMFKNVKTMGKPSSTISFLKEIFSKDVLKNLKERGLQFIENVKGMFRGNLDALDNLTFMQGKFSDVMLVAPRRGAKIASIAKMFDNKVELLEDIFLPPDQAYTTLSEISEDLPLVYKGEVLEGSRELVVGSDGQFYIRTTQLKNYVSSYSPSWKSERSMLVDVERGSVFLGSYKRDTEKMLALTNYPKTDDLTHNYNGVVMLNVPDELFNEATFWDDYNIPFLQQNADQKRTFYILSDPNDESLWYRYDVDGQIKLDNNLNPIYSGFKKEINFLQDLVQRGLYSFDSTNGCFKPIE